jgi:hypothetical protein
MRTAVLPMVLASALLAGCASAGPIQNTPTAGASRPADMFVLRSTTKTPDEVVAAIEAYATERHWNLLGADRVNQGRVTLVKLCIPEVGRQLWGVGLHVSAMLPCGNLGVYETDGHTEISLLNPRYMVVLYPDPAVEQASATAEPLLREMLDAVAQ